MAAATEQNEQIISKMVKKVKPGILQAQEKGERSFTFGVLDKFGKITSAATYAASALPQVWSGNLLKNERFTRVVSEHNPATEHPVYVSLHSGGFEAAVISTKTLKLAL